MLHLIELLLIRPVRIDWVQLMALLLFDAQGTQSSGLSRLLLERQFRFPSRVHDDRPKVVFGIAFDAIYESLLELGQFLAM